MAFLAMVRSPPLTLLQTVASLLLTAVALLSPYWCEGQQKMPKPLCTPTKHTHCLPVPGVSNSASIQLSWETGDDRFVFPCFHSGLWISCEEDIYSNNWEEKCRNFMDLTPASEKGIWWLCVVMELVYVSLLCISCLLLLLQLCLRRWPLSSSSQRWGALLNSFSAVCTVLGGLLGMVAHMMFMQVFQVTASMGPEDFNPHRYGYSWAFYMAWAAFSLCMLSGVSALNSYTRDTLLNQLRHQAWASCPPQLHPASYYCPPPPPLSPLSPYFSPPAPPPPLPLSPPPPPLPLSPPPPPPLSTPHHPSLSTPLPPPLSPPHHPSLSPPFPPSLSPPFPPSLSPPLLPSLSPPLPPSLSPHYSPSIHPPSPSPRPARGHTPQSCQEHSGSPL